ncbi:membrane insertase [Aureococcus anophagefferens]|nr:membrane insertase [Aureococcus anophagefferens]
MARLALALVAASHAFTAPARRVVAPARRRSPAALRAAPAMVAEPLVSQLASSSVLLSELVESTPVDKSGWFGAIVQALESRAKYAADPQQMNIMMAELYQENELNPLAGCLPALVQIPIFIALYRSLLSLAKEDLLEESFLWIPNLEGPVYGAQNADWLFKFDQWNGAIPPLGWHDTPQRVPAGLTIYWFCNNIITTASTLYIRQTVMAEQPVTMGGASVAAATAPAPKKLKKKKKEAASFDDMVAAVPKPKAAPDVMQAAPVVDAEIVDVVAEPVAVADASPEGESKAAAKKKAKAANDAQTARKTPANLRTPGARSSAAALRDGQSLLATYRASRGGARAAATPVGDAQASTRLFADPRTPPGAAETRELERLCALAQSISRRASHVRGPRARGDGARRDGGVLEAENERLRRQCGDLERRLRELSISLDGLLLCVDRDPIFHAREVDGDDGAPASPRSSAGPAFVPAAAPFQAREVEDEVEDEVAAALRGQPARRARLAEGALRAREVEDEAAAPIFRAREVEDEVAASSDDDATVSPATRPPGASGPRRRRWAAVPATYLRPGISISPLPV